MSHTSIIHGTLWSVLLGWCWRAEMVRADGNGSLIVPWRAPHTKLAVKEPPHTIWTWSKCPRKIHLWLRRETSPSWRMEMMQRSQFSISSCVNTHTAGNWLTDPNVVPHTPTHAKIKSYTSCRPSCASLYSTTQNVQLTVGCGNVLVMSAPTVLPDQPPCRIRLVIFHQTRWQPRDESSFWPFLARCRLLTWNSHKSRHWATKIPKLVLTHTYSEQSHKIDTKY